MTSLKRAAGRSGAGIMSVLMAVMVLIILFLLAGTFKNTGRQLLEASLAAKEFEKKFPGSEKPEALTAAERADLVLDLNTALSDADAGTRRRAGFALGRIGPQAQPAVITLIRVMSTGDTAARPGAVAGLEGIAELTVPKPVQLTLTGEALAWRARKALLKLGTPEAVRAAEDYTGACPESFRAPAAGWCD